ncbi:uncharacterized protein [Pagrus major]|uniref:uncharacterized protein n=1 Tax=Pagrus major TaxID=143350 RepID=UPI003CC83EF8
MNGTSGGTSTQRSKMLSCLILNGTIAHGALIPPMKMTHWAGWLWKSPNCKMKKLTVQGKPHLCLFAIEDIQAESEITYDYGESQWPWRALTPSVQILTQPSADQEVSERSTSSFQQVSQTTGGVSFHQTATAKQSRASRHLQNLKQHHARCEERYDEAKKKIFERERQMTLSLFTRMNNSVEHPLVDDGGFNDGNSASLSDQISTDESTKLVQVKHALSTALPYAVEGRRQDFCIFCGLFCFNLHILPAIKKERMKMSLPTSPMKFAEVQDFELVQLRQDFQLLCYTSMDPDVTPQERYSQCVRMGHQTISLCTKFLKRSSAAGQQVALLRRVVEEQEQTISQLKAQLQVSAPEPVPLSDELSDAELVAAGVNVADPEEAEPDIGANTPGAS